MMNLLPKCTCRHLIKSATRQVRYFSRSIPIASTSTSSNLKTTTTKIKESNKDWIPTIGLELHVQLRGNVKLLSSALANYESTPNTHIALFDSALPGSLPKLGSEPVKLALLACLALKSSINSQSSFDRKHYFYPDLPAGFQVTQKYSPLATGGIVKVRRDIGDSTSEKGFNVRINQIQLEQDTAKSSHNPENNLTSVDLNRAGAALIEIVTEPDMSSPEDAVAFVKHLQSLLRHIGSSDANMDKGELRCDVNVSVRRSSASMEDLGTRCEIKNLNGLRSLVGAIESEIKRQIIDLESNIPIIQSTRGYDVLTNETFHLRSKEDAPDYRYMPDPELGPVLISFEQIKALKEILPELPEDTFDRLQSQYGLTSRDARILVALGEGSSTATSTSSSEVDNSNSKRSSSDDSSTVNGAGLGVSFFEEVAIGRDSRVASNWVINELLGQLAKVDLTLGQSPISASEMGILIDAVVQGVLTGTNAKSILKTRISDPTGITLSELIKSQSSTSTSSSSNDLQTLCKAVILDLSEEAEKVRAGQEKVLMRLVGEVMKRSKGKADAKKVLIVLKELLK